MLFAPSNLLKAQEVLVSGVQGNSHLWQTRLWMARKSIPLWLPYWEKAHRNWENAHKIFETPYSFWQLARKLRLGPRENSEKILSTALLPSVVTVACGLLFVFHPCRHIHPRAEAVVAVFYLRIDFN